MKAVVLNEDGVWMAHELFVKCADGIPKVGQKVGNAEITDVPISFSNQEAYVLRLDKPHLFKRGDYAEIRD